MGHGFLKSTPFKRQRMKVITRDESSRRTILSGGGMTAPNPILGLGASPPNPVLDMGASAPNLVLSLDATIPDHFLVQSQAGPIFSWALSMN